MIRVQVQRLYNRVNDPPLPLGASGQGLGIAGYVCQWDIIWLLLVQTGRALLYGLGYGL
jgi:hypothetical protein